MSGDRQQSLVETMPDVFDGLRGPVTENASMAGVTWFQVGGPAEVMFQPADHDDLAAFLKKLPEEVPVLVVGIGSNLLYP